MQTIEIDFDVFKKITEKRLNEQVTPNDVLRELLGLEKASKPPFAASTKTEAWITGGVRFPTGTRFQGKYKGQTHHAAVKGDAFIYNGKTFYNLSAAASAIAGPNTNGWRFWSFQLPNEFHWRKASSARKAV